MANKASYYRKTIWLYIKYQILTKAFLFLIIFPVFRLILKQLILTTGQVSISSGDYLSFLFSIQGISLVIVTLIVAAILVGIDINAFVIMGALVQERRINVTAREILWKSITSLRSLVKPSGVLVIIYIALIAPIVGVGVGISATKNFKIPNFITEVIFNNKLYFGAYITLILVLTVITIAFSFFFQYLLIDQQSIGKSLKNSILLMKKHYKEFLKEIVFKIGFGYALLFTVVRILLQLSLNPFQNIHPIFYRRTLSIFTTLSITEVLAVLSMFITPYLIYKVTQLFYKFKAADGHKTALKIEIHALPISNTKLKLRTKFSLGVAIVGILVVNVAISSLLGAFFDNLFRDDKRIQVIAHRAGGDLAAENTILGMERAKAKGAKWCEIDVQRTKDGKYIINHDATFSRVAGVNKTPQEMTLQEIKQIRVKDLFNANGKVQPVPTLEEFLKAAKKNKMGVFVELKGVSANERMANDVVKMIKATGMQNNVVITSLDYKLISYVKDKYPAIKTGYLYFFSIGETPKLKSNILVMEESEATPEKIDAIHQAGKKAIVWTVDSDDSIKKFASSDVDGIITDRVEAVEQALKERNKESDSQIIIDNLLESDDFN